MNAVRSRRVGVALLLLVGGCAGRPSALTAQELRQWSREHPDEVRSKRIELRVPYRKALANLQTYSDKCLNYDRHMQFGGGAGTMFSVRSRLRPTGAASAELWTALSGAYLMVTDVAAAGVDRTVVTVYAHSEDYFEDVPAWAAGKTADCS
jgi:hypothetical protein